LYSIYRFHSARTPTSEEGFKEGKQEGKKEGLAEGTFWYNEYLYPLSKQKGKIWVIGAGILQEHWSKTSLAVSVRS
jgi:hypothetical protein